MNLLINQYGSEDDSEEIRPLKEYQPLVVCSAPSVALVTKSQPKLIRNDQVKIFTNPKAEVILAPIQGPAHPFKFNAQAPGAKLAGMGHIEETLMEDWTFNEQYQTYQRSGYALDVSSNAILGDVNGYFASNGDTAQTVKVKRDKNKRPRDKLTVDDVGGDESGPWAPLGPEELDMLPLPPEPVEEVEVEESKGKVPDGDEDVDLEADSKKPRMHIVEPDEEAEMWEKVNERKMSYVLPPRPARDSQTTEATSTFHGAEEKDYQGRSWMTAPSGVRGDNGEHECFIPKKCIRKLTGHTKGVNAIEFFPETGHLLLSASLDGKCKIWDIAGDKNVKRTYNGHTEGVRSIHMSNDGGKFVSSGFDRYMQYWDTETGQAVGTFTNRKMGYQVRFYPNDNNVFLMAASDNRIYQWDVRTGAVVQEYNYHLAPCNTITFFDQGRKFASTSDDKKILIWEYDIPVPIKYIAEPNMHSVPAVTLHPSQTAFAGQSMDNTIVVYACGDRVKQLRKKVFRGHSNSGFACQIGFSSNGKFIMSGDGQGKLHVWDWKTTKAYRKFQAHDGGPCMGAQWHPLSPSIVATCGWDGLIKLWDQ